MVIDDVIVQVARLYPDKLALQGVMLSNKWTYSQLIQSYTALSYSLQNIGLLKGDRAVIICENIPEHVIFILACAKIGVIATPINSLLSANQMIELINDSDAPILFYSSTFSNLVQNKTLYRNVKHFIALDISHSDVFSQFMGENNNNITKLKTPQEVDVHENDVLYQMYTSGTTGKSKGAMISHGNVLAELTGLNYALKVGVGDNVLIATPYFHGAAVMMSILGLALGGTCIVADKLNAAALIDHLQKLHISYCFTVPGMIINMVADKSIIAATFPKLRALIYGAAPIPRYIQLEAIKLIGSKLVQIYGQTETVMAMTLLSASEHDTIEKNKFSSRIQSVGRQIFGCEVRVFDRNNHDILPGKVGEVVARGRNIMLGYHKLHEETAKTLQDGWLRTGDLATIDDDGYIYLRGRVKDLIICDGENVYPIQIEAVIDGINDVVESAVIGVPHLVDGEEVKAVVVIKKNSSLSELDIINYCKEKLGEFQCPKSVDIVSSFTRNTGGKIIKSELRESYWDKNLKLSVEV